MQFASHIRKRKSAVVRRALTTGLTGFALLTLGAPAALAGTRTSANWSGYAAHRGGVKFHRISGSWTQPSATCSPGHKTYSAFWVGLGGYNMTSNSLEQIGTEVDCTASGAVRSTAWYELVPAGSRAVHLRVQPGDAMSASVVVVGHEVTVALRDITRHRSFVKTLHDRTVDVTSAEWIAEAPSECAGGTTGQCTPLPLADFGKVSFRDASATSDGQTGSISDSAWTSEAVELSPQDTSGFMGGGWGGLYGHRADISDTDASSGGASPSALTSGGSAFTIKYGTNTGSSTSTGSGAGSDGNGGSGYGYGGGGYGYGGGYGGGGYGYGGGGYGGYGGGYSSYGYDAYGYDAYGDNPYAYAYGY
jgi:hypothetical protein